MVERTTLRMTLVILIALACAFIVAAYAGYLVPPGIVPLGVGSHELASVVGDDAKHSVDKNLNGIIDYADSCNSCGGGGVGGAPSRVVFSVTLDTSYALDASKNPTMQGAQFPLQLPISATYTTVRLEGGVTQVRVGRSTDWSGTNSGLFLSIDWVNRKVRGNSVWHNRFSQWNVDDIQTGGSYCPNGFNPCGYAQLVVDVENRRIIRLPTEAFWYSPLGVAVVGTVTSYG